MMDRPARAAGLLPDQGLSDPFIQSIGSNGSKGAPVARSVAHQSPGVLHLAVSLQVVDRDGRRWLLQRRAASKALFPGRWANSCCTHPAPGEDLAMAAVRRLREETGLVVEEVMAAGPFTYRAVDSTSGLVEHEHDHVFVVVADTSAAAPDPSEIGDLAVLPFPEALRLVESEQGAPWAAEVLHRSFTRLHRRWSRPQGGFRQPRPDGVETLAVHYTKKGAQPMTTIRSTPVTTSDYQRDVANYWDTNTNDPVNLELGRIDDLYHHHYGLGDPDLSVLDAPDDVRDAEIIKELHRLETAQADVLLDNLGRIDPDDVLMDAGSGRGGTSIMANARFGAGVDGVSISRYQVDFANDQASNRGVGGRVQFHLRNMLDSGFPDGRFRALWTNETTMYVDLFDLYREFARLLGEGGRYVCITGCYNDVLGDKSPAVAHIDEHYICNVHARSTYFKALAAADLVPVKVVDLTAQAIPYWELRAQSSVRTGIEESFLNSYRDGSFQYLLIVADRK